MDKTSDQELVRAVQSQDYRALDLLVRRYQKRLTDYARRLGADYDSAQDIVQQTFINAYQNINGFNHKYKFSSWIYRIVHNQAVNHFKKQKKHHSLDLFDWLAEIIPSKVNVEQLAIQSDQKTQIKKCLQLLSLNYRSVVILYYFQDKKYEEISRILHIPVSTVGVRLKRAKNKLKILCQNI